MLKPHNHRADIIEKLTEEMAQPSLYDEAILALARQGFDIDQQVTTRDFSQTHAFNDSVMTAWEQVYRAPEKYWPLYELAEKLVDFEDYFRRWRFNQSPLFMEFLTGAREYECTPWGMPPYSVFGWQKPCYLLQEGYARSFQELLDETRWEEYGRASGNPACRDCMVHSGFEATSVEHAFSSWGGMFAMARAFLFGPQVPEPLLETPAPDAAAVTEAVVETGMQAALSDAGAAGTLMATQATLMMASATAGVFALAVLAYAVIGVGVGAAGTSALALLASSGAPERRADRRSPLGGQRCPRGRENRACRR